MSKKYNVEKVLYIASGDKGLHVSPAEKERGTDLHRIVTQQLKAGHIREVATDESGHYYQVTRAGKISLLVHQINWRELNSMCAEKLKAELEQMRGE